jgi:hypothetical protein
LNPNALKHLSNDLNPPELFAGKKNEPAQLFQSEQLGRADRRSIAIVTRDSSAARTDTKQNSKRKQIWKQQLEVKRRQAPTNLH